MNICFDNEQRSLYPFGFLIGIIEGIAFFGEKHCMEVLIHKDGLVIYRNKIVGQEDIIVTAEYEFCLMVHIYGLVVYPWAPDRIVEPLWNKQEVDFVEKASIKMPKFVFNKRERTLKKLVKIAQNTTR